MEGIETFHLILQSPGLFWIGEEIFVHYLDKTEDFAQCELVCKTWRQFFIQADLWKKRIFAKIARPESYQRQVIPENFDQESHEFFRSLAFKFSPKSAKKCWKESKFSMTIIANPPIVRDLATFNGSKLIYAEGNSIQISRLHPVPDKKGNLCLDLTQSLNGHRREVTCLAFDIVRKITVAGGRDRNITTWDIDRGILVAKRNEAHERLITSIKIFKDFVFSSSRDRSVKVWELYQLTPLQTLLGHHGHSVWGIDVFNSFLVTSSADRSLNIWTEDQNTNLWSFKAKMDNEEAPLRNVVILRKRPHLALSGDLLGDLKVWNLNSGLMEYQVPDPGEHGMFRKSGAIVSLSQNVDFAACAFSSNFVAIFSTDNCDTQLELLNFISVENHVDKHSFIRNVVVSDGQVYVCNVSGKSGILILDIWK